MNKKAIISLAVFSLVILVFIIFLIYPLFNQIQKESNNLILQKNRLAELENKTQSLKKFQATYKTYQPNLGKIDKLFIKSAEPIDFIEFLEKEAVNSRLSIEILPFLPKKLEEDLWPSMNFQLTLAGSFPNFLKFLEKIESSPYLIKTLNLDIKKLGKRDVEAGKLEGPSEGDIKTTLLIRAYTK